MDYLYILLFVFIASVTSIIPSNKGKLDNKTILELISWQETIEEVNKTNPLAQVLKEYLKAIELVEEATSKCSENQRDRYLRAQHILQSKMALCVESSKDTRQPEVLAKCVKEKTSTSVSDVRLHITRLKQCLDDNVY